MSGMLLYETIDKFDYEYFCGFDCGDEGLNNFLRLKANKCSDPTDCRGTTTLVTYNRALVGYYTLKNTSLLFKPDSRKLRGIPAIEITYLAIDKRYQKQGYGSTILQNIIYETFRYSEEFSEVNAIVVSSLKDKVHFYEKNKFVKFTEIFDLPYDSCREVTEQMFLNMCMEL